MKINIIFLLSFVSFSACKTNDEERGSAVSGTFTLFCDNSSYPVVKVLTQTYSSLYPEVVVLIDSSDGNSRLNQLASLNGYSAVTSQKINTQDSLALISREIYFNQFHFATDAIAFIMNKSDSMTPKNHDYLSLLSNCKNGSDVKICTDEPGSDNNSTVKNLVPEAGKCMSQWLNLHDFKGVHSYVSQNAGTMGLISWSQMCDTGDPEVKKLREAITVVPIYGLKSSSSTFYPVQSAIADGEYPLTKKLYLVTTEPFSGPATGFAAFVASSEGQRIIRLFGIQPASIPTREIIIN